MGNNWTLTLTLTLTLIAVRWRCLRDYDQLLNGLVVHLVAGVLLVVVLAVAAGGQLGLRLRFGLGLRVKGLGFRV